MNRPVFNASWLIRCPNAHPFWNWYALFLVDLTTPSPDDVPAHKLFPEATHELTVWALDPANDAEYRAGKHMAFSAPMIAAKASLLYPMNHGYQWAAKDNSEAEARVASIYNDLSSGALNPDTDFKAMWNARYPDWKTLRIT